MIAAGYDTAITASYHNIFTFMKKS